MTVLTRIVTGTPFLHAVLYSLQNAFISITRDPAQKDAGRELILTPLYFKY